MEVHWWLLTVYWWSTGSVIVVDSQSTGHQYRLVVRRHIGIRIVVKSENVYRKRDQQVHVLLICRLTVATAALDHRLEQIKKYM